MDSEKKTSEKGGQINKKITFALENTSIRFFNPVTSNFVEILCAYLFLVTIFLTICHCPFSPIVVTMPSSNSTDLLREKWEKKVNFCDEDYHYDFLVFCQHHIDLEVDESKMEPARQKEGSNYAGFDPVIMSDDSQPFASKNVNQDCCRSERSQYQLPRSDATR